MDFQFTPQQEKFRLELLDFLERELPPDWRWRVGTSRYEEEVATTEELSFYRSFQRKLGQGGWLAHWWPKQYGGQERTRVEFAIFRDELAYYGAPGVFGPTYELCVPMLLAHGTEEQKHRFLPPLARGDIVFCQGFSEPNAGSDMAAITARAVEDGDSYILSGQKTWVTAAEMSDWGFFLFRTDPQAQKHRGLGMFVVELNTPGLHRRTIYDLAGLPAWQEIFFDGARVPKANLVGGKNNGWQVAMYVLNNERSGIVWLGGCRRALARLVKYVKETAPLAGDPAIRHRLAALAVDVEVARLTCYYVASMHDKGITPIHEASMAKLLTCTASERLAEAGMEILGLPGQLDTGSKHAPLWGGVARTFLSYPMWVLGGGSLEVQKDVIARIGLGLPR